MRDSEGSFDRETVTRLLCQFGLPAAASEHSPDPDVPPVFCWHMGMVCASNCKPGQCFEQVD